MNGDLAARVAGNLKEVRQRMAVAAARSGRRSEDIQLVAVTKYVGLEEIRAIVQAGCADLGESRPQQLWERAEILADLPIRWHLIGHLQRNKVRRTVSRVSLVHSVDSARLVAAIDDAAAQATLADGNDTGWDLSPDAGQTDVRLDRGERAARIPILLEVNISGEAAKHGFSPAELVAWLPEAEAFRHVQIHGLMCMAGLEGDLDDARRQFAALRCLRDRLRAIGLRDIALEELSMGMSGDYEVAIEEGATMVRIGSALFEGL